MQVACVIPEQNLQIRQIDALLVGCVCVFLTLFVVNYLDFIKKTSENDYLEWDLKTITAGDYTIEFDLDPQFFEDWVDKEYTSWSVISHRKYGKHYVAKVDAFRDWI